MSAAVADRIERVKADLPKMTAIERHELIGVVWDSMDDEDTSLGDWQVEELKRRRADAIVHPNDHVAWEDVRSELLADL